MPRSHSARPRHRRVCTVAVAVLAASLAALGCGEDAAGSDAGSAADSSAGADSADSGGNRANWAQGYSIKLKFVGGEADGVSLAFDRDLFDIPTAFSFGSTHYVHGEVGFAMADTQTLMINNGRGKPVQSQLQVGLNFGLVIGSTVNPVHTDKAGAYPFSCKPPVVRIVLDNTQYRSTCAGLQGVVDIQSYANTTGGRLAGTFKGRAEAVYPSPSYPDDCDPVQNKQTCKKPDRYVDIEGTFGFTLPAKADGGG